MVFVRKLLEKMPCGAFENFFDKKYYSYLFSPLIRTIKQSMNVDWSLEQSIQNRV